MLNKKYDHLIVEKDKYAFWKDKGYFECGDLSKEPFCIVIPPPNVTGRLHLGHAWDTALQDIIIRYKRMDGYDTLWLPGMDHAAIATENRVVEKLKSKGIDKRELGRDKFLDACWDWSNEHKELIRDQWAKLGLSLDYTKERFTLDEGLNKAVTKVFIDLYNKGWIYKGERIINWDPEAETALSNEEVIYKEVEGAFYHLKYFIEDSDEYLTVATTRPETLLGDTAIAVNPKDKRYKHFIGKNVILPILDRIIPIIEDSYADMEFGTGVLKITPAHDPNDFEIGNRHNLERINVLNPNGTMNENAGIYKDLDRFDCRKKLVSDLKEKDLLIKIENIKHNVGHSERTDVMIEPYLSKQWFVKMDTLAKQVLDNQKDKDKKVNFVPIRFEKIMNHWMEIAYDWCISRQQWWGHRIPAWYKGDEIIVSEESPGPDWIQDPDVLDTWFSSALWPFSTLDWPDGELLKRYYPNDVLVTGYDIIFFWVCRMVFSGLEFCGEKPFNEVLIHGLIRDKQGRKMSKSLDNGVDPMDMIDKYGADSLRFFLTTSSSPGQDLRFDEEKVAATWNFVNKLWNASRFVLMNVEGFEKPTFDNLSVSDKWILTKLNKTIKVVRKHMDKYEFNVVGTELHRFIWNDFCDWYIELSKINRNESVLIHVLDSILKMLHPFMPYVTEEIYQMLPNSNESIMISDYPIYNKEHIFKEEKDLELLIELVTKIRKTKADNNIGKEYTVVYNDSFIDKNLEFLIKLLKNENFTTNFDRKELEKVELNFNNNIVYVYYKGMEVKQELIEKEIDRLTLSVDRRTKLLANKKYVSNAPKEIVENERETLYKEQKELELLMKKKM